MKQLFITIGALLFSSILYGQAGGVGINNNGTAPNASAMLDVESTSKGLLVPRVALTNTTDATTIANGNVTSLLVYNTATIADVVPGYYYWDGTVWKTLGGDADADPNNEIQDLQIVGNSLTITNNGTPTTIDLSPYLDNTDNQNIDSVSLNGTNLTVYIENGTAATVDLSALASDHDWYEVGGTAAPDNINDDIYTQGNVGIGTTTPSGSLDVINNNGRLRVGTGGETYIERNSGNTLTVRNTDNVSTSNLGHIILERGDGSGDDFSITTMSDLANGVDKIGFTFGTTINAVINKTGEVGIGTTTPTNSLEVAGDGTVYLNNASAGVRYQDDQSIFIGPKSGSSANGAIITATGNGAGYVRLNPEGGSPSFQLNVTPSGTGIGTGTPTTLLDIAGDLRVRNIAAGSGSDVSLVADANGVVKQVAPNPVGEIIIYPLAVPPSGYLTCDGSAVSRTTYADLFNVLGTSYGDGDGSTTFNLPDLRGEFIRGWDNGAGNDPDSGTRTDRGDGTTGNNVGTKQNDAIRNIIGRTTYIGNDVYAGRVTGAFRAYNNGGTLPYHTTSDSGSGWTKDFDASRVVPTANDNRPRNIAMHFCIRF